MLAGSQGPQLAPGWPQVTASDANLARLAGLLVFLYCSFQQGVISSAGTCSAALSGGQTRRSLLAWNSAALGKAFRLWCLHKGLILVTSSIVRAGCGNLCGLLQHTAFVPL